MNLLSYIQSLFSSDNHYTGLNPDPRLSSEKQKDYAHEERAVATPTDPFGNLQILKSPYFYENQNQTSSCVFHGTGLALAIERKADVNEYVRISQIFGYRLRNNYPSEGYYLQGGCDIYRHNGAPLYTTLPTPINEALANSIVITDQERNEAQIYKGGEYYTVRDYTNIDTIAGIAQQGHGVPILIYATQDEWGRDYPEIQNANMNPNYAPIRHCVCVLPNSGFMLGGKKYVTIQDSAWFGGKQLRYLSEDFVKARCYGAVYWDTVQILSSGPRPKYNFVAVLKYGSTGKDVTAMQQLFVAEGLLPTDCVTGNFYGRTLAALHAFQNKYAADILIPNGLTAPTDTWGASCIKKANLLCQ